MGIKRSCHSEQCEESRSQAFKPIMEIPRFTRDDNGLKGFTLIELLLVIVILSILAIFFLNFYEKNTRENKITIAAEQIQQILQAADVYFVDNHCWPDTNNSAICPALNPVVTQCNNPNPPSFDQYLPVGLTSTPWGGNYQCQAEPTMGKKFQVYANNLPTENIAVQLKNSLSNAKINPATSTYQIQTEISEPILSAQTNPSIFIATIGTTGNLQDGSTFSFDFKCPANMQGAGFAVPWNIFGLRATGNPNCVNQYLSRSIALLNPNLICNTIAPGTYRCGTDTGINFYSYVGDSLCHNAGQGVNAGNVSLFYIGWCQTS